MTAHIHPSHAAASSGAVMLGNTHVAGEAQQRRFDPYSDNGGTILAISSHDFVIVGSDTRQSEGYSIQSRYTPRVFPLTSTTVITIQGFQGDADTFVKRLKQRIESYSHTHHKEMELPSIARMIQTMLYGKRFFPFYTYVILGGIDRDGTGAVYSFDPVGSYERESCRAAGSAQSLVQPFLDAMVNGKNQLPAPGEQPLGFGERANLPLERVLGLVTDAFTGATEREIYVGDMMELYVIRIIRDEKSGKMINTEMGVLRKALKQD